MIKKPNFLIVGGAKSGTSSLYHYLKQHPDIFLPKIKEPLYFIRRDVLDKLNSKDIAIKNENLVDKLPKSFNEYLRLFNSVSNEKFIGECSATYLYYYRFSIPNIKNKLGDVKIIIILRNPVDKAFSQYKHLKRLGAEKLNFEESLELENERIKNNYSALYHYRNQCSYYNQVKAFKENFQDVLILKTDDLKNDPQKVLNKIIYFLGINKPFNFNTSKLYNVSDFIPKSYRFYRFVNHPTTSKIRKSIWFILGNGLRSKARRIYHKKNNENLVISYKTEKLLKHYFKSDLIKLQGIIDTDISGWLTDKF